MTVTTQPYDLSVTGHLDAHWATWLHAESLEHIHDGTTCIRTEPIDQAQLHGVLNQLRDLGAPLQQLSAVEPGSPRTEGSGIATLRTNRLTLRAATTADADATWMYRHLPQVAEWLTELPSDSAAYRDTFTEPGRLADTVIIEYDGEVIGDFMFRVEDAWSQAEVRVEGENTQAELGWVLDPVHTGAGYATEAAQALITHAFEDLGLRRVHANSFLNNDASWRLMERVGMRREQHAVRESLHRSGAWLDTVTYALLADERATRH